MVDLADDGHFPVEGAVSDRYVYDVKGVYDFSSPTSFEGIRRTPLDSKGATGDVTPKKGLHWDSTDNVSLFGRTDGAFILFGYSGDLWVASDSSDRAAPIFTPAPDKYADLEHAGMMPDRRHLVFVLDDGRVKRVCVSDGTEKGTVMLPGDLDYVEDVCRRRAACW